MADKNKNNYLYIGIAVVVVIVLAIVFISNSNNNSQNEVTCNSPYIKVGTSCCLDQNNNNVCDNDETPTQQEQSSQPSSQPSQPRVYSDHPINEVMSSLKDGETAYYYFSGRKGGDLEVIISHDSRCPECNANYFTFELMTLDECHNKQRSLSYKTLEQRSHTDFVAVAFGRDIPLEKNTDFCIAVGHDDYSGNIVTKLVEVDTFWTE